MQLVPALPVQVVDSVGAGDAFNAALAVGLSEDKPVGESIAMGVTAASLSTQHRETIESYHRRPDVDAHLARVLRSIRPFVPMTMP
jgi:ribokinase